MPCERDPIIADPSIKKQKQVLLCTAMIKVRDSKNNFISARCILDSASQANFARQEFINKLGIPINDSCVSISCLGNGKKITSGQVDIIFTSHFNGNEKYSTSAFLIDKITEKTPFISVDSSIKDYFRDLNLADPEFYRAKSIDILLGTNAFFTLLNSSVVKRNPNLPFAVSTKLGWVISGNTLSECSQQNPISVNCISTNTLIQRFWELEQVPNHSFLTKEEKLCEDQFKAEHKRDSSGRYSVSLPFKTQCHKLGNSKDMAIRRFINLEKRLLLNSDIYEQYKNFMKEYFTLGHMEKVTTNSDTETAHYYLPHHYVIKESSLSTKLRVVFDASAKSSTGVSLNDTLLVGPKVQADLFSIVLRFRCHEIAITADLTKMYRQVKIHESDRDFQRIVWRDNPNKPLETFRLSTVTYGTASASFLATRALKQLALDEGRNFQRSARVVLEDFYVDDVLTGTSTINEGRELVIELTELLRRGGFEPHKWVSSNPMIFQNTEVGENAICLQPNSNKAIKVLGIEWHPNEDQFSCSIYPPQITIPITKRKILSVISSIFDPLGWIAPFVVSAKIFLQQLWKLDLSWDAPIPESINQEWQSICEKLSELNSIRIPRKILSIEANQIELHAFCDASEKAYAAVIYVRSISKNNEIEVKLIASKTRVAPLKCISLPRLELCAALLLARLINVVQPALQLQIENTYAWSDSSIVLAWLAAEPSRWKTFVANRVCEIQTIAPNIKWSYVNTKENPADCASRGVSTLELVYHNLWWSGPPWLSKNDIPTASFSHDRSANEEILMEERKIATCAISEVQTELLPIILNISSFSKLQRIIAWCLRFVTNARLATADRRLTFLTSSEICAATSVIIRLVQETTFSKEIQCLKSRKNLPTNSVLYNLCPFLDSSNLLRIGGRLKNAKLSLNEKHPIILPKKHHLTNIIIIYFHIKYLHAAPEFLLSIIRQRFWIVAARSTIRLLVRKCVICCRYRAQTAKQIMADLPENRVTPSRPFQCTGLDYAGPFLIKHRTGRGQKSFKSYICIFVCFATKAVHLEVSEDLSTQAFLSAFKRFISRRGKPSEIYSDCGTNFIGANKEIRKHFLSFNKNEKVQDLCASEEIKWNFNPPGAPHFGGLWEAAVKSMKYHLKRTIGDTILTYPEFVTLITHIEACLNSRPLCPTSSDPSDYTALTPGHFLIGTALTALPEPDVSQSKLSHLDRWHVRQAILQQFWKRWSTEYLCQMQQRKKWCKTQPNLAVNDLVFIKDENTPPLKWRLGRVIQVHPGTDNRVRVATVKTVSGLIKRPITKLCPLLMDNN